MPDSIFGQGRGGTPGLGAAGSGGPTAHDIATRMIAFGKARSQAFAPYGLEMNDLAWALLLGLFVAQERGRRLSLTSLCDETAAPNMVLVRWLRTLLASGLVEYDEGEGLSAPVRLTVSGETALRGLIEL